MEQHMILSSLVFAGAVSLDALSAAIAYGADRIHIPMRSSIVIAGVCTLCLAISLGIGYTVYSVVPLGFAKWIGFWILCLLGGAKLLDGGIKIMIRRFGFDKKQWNFSAFHIRFILTVYADPKTADRDGSHDLSPKEAFWLALALSLDGIAAGFGGGMTNFCPGWVLGFTFFCTLICVLGGALLGEKISQKSPIDLSIVSGVILVALAVAKCLG